MTPIEMQTKPCPAPGCRKETSAVLCACEAHWIMLPLKIKRGYLSAVKARDKTGFQNVMSHAKQFWDKQIQDGDF